MALGWVDENGQMTQAGLEAYEAAGGAVKNLSVLRLGRRLRVEGKTLEAGSIIGVVFKEKIPQRDGTIHEYYTCFVPHFPPIFVAKNSKDTLFDIKLPMTYAPPVNVRVL